MNVTTVPAITRGLEERLAEGPVGMEDCRLFADILMRIGDKWSVLTVIILGTGPRRFNELRRLVNGISQRMLTLTLRGLERDGIVLRTVTPSVPPRVDYELTPLGSCLLIPISGLAEWAAANRTVIEESRKRFDATVSA